MTAPPQPTTRPSPVEVGWFSALCDDDYEYLGVPQPDLRSSWEHCRAIALDAQRLGYDNLLLPSGYQLGIDAVAFAGGLAPLLDQAMTMLLAVRMGEVWPPQLARQLATLDRMCGGRLKVNIISSDLPGTTMESEPRYRRTLEAMTILRTLLNGEPLEHHGEFYDLVLDPPNATTLAARCPPLYFGGLSDAAREVAAAAADVYLMWPETEADAGTLVADLRARAERHGRALKFGFRVHVVVRDTEVDARRAAANLVSRLDPAVGESIRAQSLDSASVGVRRQQELREHSDDDGFVEDCLWTGIGRARSGCGAALVGDPDQVRAKLERYRAIGIDAFILSGYPHRDECQRFGDLVLPDLDHASL